MTNDPLIGRQLANFRVECVIGRGGMAQVYYGWDVRLKRPVAIKVLDARFRGNPSYAQRFVREAQAVATWRHENILQVYYADEEEGLYYFVMEYIDGLDLGTLMSQYLAKGELLPHADLLRIGRAVASALDYAHQKGVVHRDVKPSNVMVARDGRVVLSDFGLALDVEQGSMGEVFGTAHYIAPEQARRSSDAIPQSDLYSLGVILYEILTGTVPFDDPSPTSVAIQHITLRPPSPREINPDLSVEVEAVVLKALSKSPQERYQAGSDLIAALESALQVSRPAAVQRPSLPPPPAGMRFPADRRLSQMSVAEVIASRSSPDIPMTFGTRAPRTAASPAQAALPQPGSSTLPQRRVTVLVGLGGCAFALIVTAVVGGLLLPSQLSNIFPILAQHTETARATTPAALQTPTAIAPPTQIVQPSATSATSASEATATGILALTATSPVAAETPTLELPTAVPAPTVKYPNGKRFVLYYDDNSLYLLNLSDSVVSIYSVAFERLDAASTPLNRFDGWRWAQFYPNSKPEWCMRIEILGSASYLRPPECSKGYLSTRTPTRDDPVVFWTAKEGSPQFRVLWKEGDKEEEVARCEIAVGTCEVFFP